MSADSCEEIRMRLESVLQDIQSISCDLYGQFTVKDYQMLSSIRDEIIYELEELNF